VIALVIANEAARGQRENLAVLGAVRIVRFGMLILAAARLKSFGMRRQRGWEPRVVAGNSSAAV